MLLLALDTSSPAVTVAIHDGDGVIGRATGEGATAHAELLAPAIADALTQCGARPHELTDVAVGVGPGPFTGLRVGIVTARTLGSTLGIATHGVCSLDILATQVEQPATEFLVATDARRKEVYWAHYDAAALRLDGPFVDRPEDVAARSRGLPVYGRGATLHANVLAGHPGPIDPSADALAQGVVDGRFLALSLEPLYLRRPDVTLAAGPKRA